ncbi:MAG TPA: ChaN family lipoprotein [Gemmatimonadales bacterium]
MPRTFLSLLVLLLAACGRSGPAMSPGAMVLPEGVSIVESGTGAALETGDLLNRMARSEFVLLGELHDNPIHHQVRGSLIRAAGSRPAVVFEQFQASSGPIPLPGADQSREAWLDANGFDRTGWRWPLHQPVVEAAIGNARSVWGSGISRDQLRAVVRGGDAAAPEELRRLMEASPLGGAARAAIDSDLVAGHCGQLPESMIPGMRSAQVVRDASMTQALLSAAKGGPAWLIAGNGHVRADVAVPRLLTVAAPGKRLLVVGLLERGADGTMPDRTEQGRYDVVIVTPRAERGDPCASLRR